jgi:hypothetical protein
VLKATLNVFCVFTQWVKRFFGWNHYTSWGLCVPLQTLQDWGLCAPLQTLQECVLCCFISCFILMMISGHLLYCFMLFYFLVYTDGDLRTYKK